MRLRDAITTIDQLRDLLGTPRELAVRKQLDHLDQHCRAFIARSPLVLVGSVGATGTCDVSPRGDAPGFVPVLDDQTLAIPERPGNRRLDTLQNVLATGRVGLLFLVPGVQETLRVNGRASLVRDADLMERCTARGKRPVVAIVVTVEEAYLHCGKALIRSQLWEPEQWPPREVLPTLARVLYDQIHLADCTEEQVAAEIEESYLHRLY
jgi:PPOX class probable FMN-dependent enzyme